MEGEFIIKKYYLCCLVKNNRMMANWRYNLHVCYNNLRFWRAKACLMMRGNRQWGLSPDERDWGRITVSLTSHGSRIDHVWCAIESVMQQSLPADRIVLWLDEEDRGRGIPKRLRRLMARGLEIVYTPHRIGPYKKLIPALEACKGDVIVTVDDDCIYGPRLLESLVSGYLRAPESIHAMRFHSVVTDDGLTPAPYSHWRHEVERLEDELYPFFTGVGGVLYPPGVFDDVAVDCGLFLALSPTADDVWFNAMALRCGVKVHKCSDGKGVDFVVNHHVQGSALGKRNYESGCGNDESVNAVNEVFGVWNFKNKAGR